VVTAIVAAVLLHQPVSVAVLPLTLLVSSLPLLASESSPSDSVTLVLVQESHHRWSGGTWLTEKFSVLPGLRAGEGLRTTLETGVTVATSPFFSINVGVLQRYDVNAAVRRSDPVFVTAIALKLP